MDLNDVLVFAKVVHTGSFIGAARELGIPKSTVSRRVSELEERLGARLLQRTTRKLNLTEVGHTYYRHAIRVVSELEEAEQAINQMQTAPRGLLRVTTPINFGFLSPIIVAFMRRYPEVHVELVGLDRNVDLVDEGFDIAIRAGELRDSSLVARSLGALKNYLVASPEFLRREGTPKEPEDVQASTCLAFGAGPERSSWKLTRDGRTVSLDIHGKLVVNDFDFLEEAVRAGLGIAMLPVFRCIDDLRTKKLERVLPEWCTRDVPLHAVYPSTRHLSPKVKALLDHLREHMTPPPWERGPLP